MKTTTTYRAINAARNAAIDAATKGWWSHPTAIPTRYRSGNGWVVCRSIHWTTKVDGQWVPSGVLLAAAIKAASRALGVKPNNEVAIKIAVDAASVAGGCDLSQFRVSDLISLRNY